MQYTIEELRHKLFPKIYDVYEVFKNHFGEAYVDLQNLSSGVEISDLIYACTDVGSVDVDSTCEISDADIITLQSRLADRKASIIVWWPRVTITNEHNKSINIQDLYAKVVVNTEGKIPYENWGFQLTRSTYDSTQFQSGFMHSHCPGFNTYTDAGHIVAWQSPCLGTGPIKGTIHELKNNNDEVTWMLFCEELARYVTVESLTGGPYRKLEEVGVAQKLAGYDQFTEVDSNLERLYRYNDTRESFFSWLKEFTLYYLHKGHLCFNYQDRVFKQGLSYFDYMIDISNAFIEWYNMTGEAAEVITLFNKEIIINSFAADGKFYKQRRTSTLDITRYEGTHVLWFKGNDIVLHIDEAHETELETTILLNHKIAMFILQSILRIINYRYRNEYNSQQRAGNQKPAPAYQAVVYL